MRATLRRFTNYY